MTANPHRRRIAIAGAMAGATLLALAAATGLPHRATTPARAEGTAAPALPAPPPGGVLAFVVQDFVPPVVPGMDACPHGTAPRLREIYLRTLPEAEQARLRLKENEKELTRLWHAYALGADGSNICSQPDRFQHAPFPPVESKLGYGLDLDGGKPGKDGCAHAEFESPTGIQGVDNQEYRALGCQPEIRGPDGNGGDALTGMKQFHTSGEWTQVIVLKGVDSLVDDPDVEVIYANTADRPEIDSKGQFLRGVSFTVNDTAPRHRNVLHGRIHNGVLTTDPADIALAETWGQGGARDIRGNRSQYHYRQGRLRLEFQPDGTLRGMIGGYRPIFDVITSGSLGGAGTAVVAGIDCAAQLASLRQYADGGRDPKTGQCTTISSAMRILAVPAFVTDLTAADGSTPKHAAPNRSPAR
ncbi:MAG: hypothetical protein KGM17_13785 [Sphingomonadales bacterium]|nr:hypothetical protein [Sphingomonadales bacterium]